MKSATCSSGMLNIWGKRRRKPAPETGEVNTTSKGMLAMDCTTARTEAMKLAVTKSRKIQSALIQLPINLSRTFIAGKCIRFY